MPSRRRRPEAAPDLERMVEAVEILSAERFTVEGDPCVISRAGAVSTDGWLVAADEAAIVRELAREIYGRLYTRAGGSTTVRPNTLARRRHLARLAKANCGRGTWEPGWTIRERDEDGRLAVQKDGLTFWVAADRLRLGGTEPEAGTPCRMKVGKELREQQQGFYIAIGDGGGGGEDDEAAPLVRLYWHLAPSGAVPFMRLVTARLNPTGIAFRAKVLSDPGTYVRADAGVVYLPRHHVPAVRDALTDIWHEVRDHLRPTVPLLTRRLAPGLGVAEDPGGGSSFGQHRSLLIARALWRASQAGQQDDAERLTTVVEAFRDRGLDPRRPHLGPGSGDSYPTLVVVPVGAAESTKSAVESPSVEPFLDAARRIGDKLVADAWWHRRRCNWMGRTQDETEAPWDPVTPTSGALDSSLYGGTSGVGLFLAELYARTGEHGYRRTALGALRQATTMLRDEPDLFAPRGFLEGRLGVAWAARRTATLCKRDDLAANAETLLVAVLRSIEEGDDEPPLDFLSGNAGSILALLDWHRTGPSERSLAAAVTLGEELCRRAHKTETGWTWDLPESAGFTESPWLTGFAHGAAGVGLALLELFAATGCEEFRVGARHAFAYEDGLFDAAHGNWPDLRVFDPDAAEDGGGEPDFMTAWCHGAPGIILSRLRALQLDPDNAPAYLEAVDAGLATTLRTLERSLQIVGGDASLCHGASGLGEVILTCGQILERESCVSRAQDAALRLVERHSVRGDWPSGAASRGSNPSLFLGTAGIGHWMLRLHAGTAVPSVLLPASISGSTLR